MSVTRIVATLDGRTITLKGREAWALHALHVAGNRGVTPLENPAPRWSHYVFKLRQRGFLVETIHEHHAGAYAGTHARYVLRSAVTLLDVEQAGRAVA